MALAKERGIRVTSNAFGFRQDKEKREERRISIDGMAEETGLAPMTVRRFLDRDNDVSNSPIIAAVVMARYLEVSLADLLTIHAEEAASDGQETNG